MGRIKKTYRLAASLALWHLLAGGAFGAYWLGSGRLDLDRMRRIAAILAGKEEPMPMPAESSDPSRLLPVLAESKPAERREDEELAWRTAERYRVEIEQRLKFINAERLDLTRQREELERLREQDRRREQEEIETVSGPGYEKELELVTTMAPKAALKHLLTLPDADAARVLFELETRKAKKIIESAKTAEESTKIEMVLRLMRELKPLEKSAGGGEGQAER